MNKCKEFCLSRQHGRAEVLTLLLYLIGVGVIACFHEPWFDEAQAWQIARCASLREILFEIPHYEGHPQLWHLLLMPFAKLGAPFELTLKGLNLLLCAVAVWLILYRSPFPKIVRIVLPFTYFVFYQFGVLARPYCLMMIAVCLAAMGFRTRNEKPLRYLLPLLLLALSSAYGMVLAGGMCMVWAWEIVTEYRQKGGFSGVLRDCRAWGLLGLLAVAVFVLLCIIPAEDCYYAGGTISTWTRISRLWLMVMIPFDAMFGNFISYTETFETIGGAFASCVGGLLSWVLLIVVFRQGGRLLQFLLPFVLLCAAHIYVQFSPHHLGIELFYILFLFWIIADEQGSIPLPGWCREVWGKLESALVRGLAKGVGLLLVVIPVFFTVTTSVNDIRYDYGYSCVVPFLQEHGLDERTMMVMWNFEFPEPEDEEKAEFVWDETLPAMMPGIEVHRPYMCGTASTVLPYYDENIFMNFNVDDPDAMYMKWIDATDDPAPIFEQWRAQGLPEVVLGFASLADVYTEAELEGVTYYWVKTFYCHKLFKMDDSESNIKIYVREDVLEDFPELEIQEY